MSSMVKRIGKWLVILLAVIGFGVVVAGAAFLATGISAKAEPTALEVALAHRLRSVAIPSAAKKRQNPVPAGPEALEEGMAHWADHCAVCHGNNGDGQTELGRGLHPRAPDMRLPATQRLGDGTLFFIIEEGVKLTGMPAWGTGTPEGEEASWKLVRFIRHLPKLTPDEIEKMEAMNPTSPEADGLDEEMRRFLAGEDVPPKPLTKPIRHGAHK